MYRNRLSNCFSEKNFTWNNYPVSYYQKKGVNNKTTAYKRDLLELNFGFIAK